MARHLARSQAKTLYLLLRVLAGLSLILLGALAIAPAQSHFSEWRAIQQDYNREALAAGLAPMEIGMQQIWREELEIADRCTSCHVGMGAATPLPDGGALFGRHPEVHHDVVTMGCTPCHRGQGRATTAEAAHGHVHHWTEPMLPEHFEQASCGGCHGDAARVHTLALAEEGAYLFELHGCRACHVVDGDGGDVGPDLSGVALKGYDRDWHVRHLRDPVGTVEGSKMMSFGHLRDDEIDAVVDYMDTLVGAPKMMAGKALAMELGCRGCHVIGGVGGDVSVDLTEAASTSMEARDFSGVEGEHTLDNWHREHLRDPIRVAPGSVMPVYLLPQELEDGLITYILSLRDPGVPLEELPPQTRLVRLQGARDFEEDGETLYGMLCASCHGADAEGLVVESLDTTVPAIGNPDMLTVASDAYLRTTLDEGRPGRNMPSWGPGSGLNDDEIDELLAHLRLGLDEPADADGVVAAVTGADPADGERRFASRCAGCHGMDAGGTDLGPSLTAPELLWAADDRFLATTVIDGRRGTAMPAHPELDEDAIAGVLAWLRTADPGNPERYRAEMRAEMRVADPASYTATGSAAYGAYLFLSSCAGCHGENGLGGHGPAIAGGDFLRTASDGFVASTILLGRSQRAMKPFGPHGITPLERREIADIIVFLRQRAADGEEPSGATAQGNTELGREAFAELCAGCHGEQAEGRTGPSLHNAAFLRAASDGFLQATIARGRDWTAMRAWAVGGLGFAELEPTEINDIVAYIRSGEDD